MHKLVVVLVYGASFLFATLPLCMVARVVLVGLHDTVQLYEQEQQEISWARTLWLSKQACNQSTQAVLNIHCPSLHLYNGSMSMRDEWARAASLSYERTVTQSRVYAWLPIRISNATWSSLQSTAARWFHTHLLLLLLQVLYYGTVLTMWWYASRTCMTAIALHMQHKQAMEAERRHRINTACMSMSTTMDHEGTNITGNSNSNSSSTSQSCWTPVTTSTVGARTPTPYNVFAPVKPTSPVPTHTTKEGLSSSSSSSYEYYSDDDGSSCSNISQYSARFSSTSSSIRMRSAATEFSHVNDLRSTSPPAHTKLHHHQQQQPQQRAFHRHV